MAERPYEVTDTATATRSVVYWTTPQSSHPRLWHGSYRTRGEADAVAAAIRPRYAAETVPVRVEYVAPRRPPKEAH